MTSKESRPPKWADRLLSWFCKKEVLENVQGDLYEIYQKRVNMLGARKAQLLFIRDMLSILRPRLTKKLQYGYRLDHPWSFVKTPCSWKKTFFGATISGEGTSIKFSAQKRQLSPHRR